MLLCAWFVYQDFQSYLEGFVVTIVYYITNKLKSKKFFLFVISWKTVQFFPSINQFFYVFLRFITTIWCYVT